MFCMRRRLRVSKSSERFVSQFSKPVIVVMGLKDATFSVEALAAVGAKRIIVGVAFARAALGAFVRPAREVKDKGTFTFAADAITYGEASGYLANVKR
jgi:2-methylisocitrate lyase-like PEP mutase family enzyme